MEARRPLNDLRRASPNVKRRRQILSWHLIVNLRGNLYYAEGGRSECKVLLYEGVCSERARPRHQEPRRSHLLCRSRSALVKARRELRNFCANRSIHRKPAHSSASIMSSVCGGHALAEVQVFRGG